MDDLDLLLAVKRMLQSCENTEKYPFNSRRFLEVGEYELAFEGIIMFAEGNLEFKKTIQPDYDQVCSALVDKLDFSRLPPHEWEASKT